MKDHALKSFGLLAIAAAVALSGCSGGATGATSVPVTSVNPVSPTYSSLQFVVGTANFGGGVVGLNTVETLRQPNGLSAVGYSTPAITWDGAFTNAGASTLDGASKNIDDLTSQITGTLPAALGTTGKISTFGQGTGSWGAFGYGFYPANSGPGNVNSSITYPCLPVYATAASSDPACAAGARYIGGPPAFPVVNNGSQLAGQIGATLGFTPFLTGAPAPAAGTGTATFTLTVQIPTGFQGSTATYGSLTAVAKMNSFAPLGDFATPTFTPNATGGGAIGYALPAGATEAYLIIANYGPGGNAGTPNCNFGRLPQYYTVRVKAGDPATIALGDNLGPTPAIGVAQSFQKTKTFCSAADNAAVPNNTATTGSDQYVIYAAGADYPMYGSSYPNSNVNAKPAIAGANGQADITISPQSAATAVGT